MNINIIKENLSSFIFVILIMIASWGTGFVYIIKEYKALQSEKVAHQEQVQKEKLQINNEKNEIELMKKELENKILQAKLDIKDNQKVIIDLQKEGNAEFIKEFQNYKVTMNSMINKKDLKIESLVQAVNTKDNEIVSLNALVLELKSNKEELTKQIEMINKAEKITNLISQFSKKYSAIDKDTYDKYSDYVQALREYEGIVGLIKTYKLNDEYSDFIRNMNRKLYVYK